MKVKLTITFDNAEYELLQSIPDLENYITKVIQEEIEVPNYSHVVIEDLDTNIRTIKTEWEESLPKGL